MFKKICFWKIFILIYFLIKPVFALPADINESNRVDGFDLILFSRVKGATPSSPNWMQEADINKDNIIDEKDLDFFTIHFARKGVVSSLWTADYNNNKIVRLSGKTGKELLRLSGFLNPYSIAVNPLDGSCWVSDYGNNRVIKLNSQGVELLNITGFNHPQCVAINSRDGSCWVGDYNNVTKLSYDGQKLFQVSGFYNPKSLDIDLLDGSCWIADYDHNQVVKLNAGGTELVRKTGFNKPNSVCVDQYDGACWIADQYNNQIVKLISTGSTELLRVGGFNQPCFVSINIKDRSVWIADYINNNVVKFDKNGGELARVGGFNRPISVCADSFDGGCWVADYENSKIVKLSTKGKEVMRLSGFNHPKWVSLVPEEIKPDAPYVTVSADKNRINPGEEIVFSVSGSDTGGFIQKYELDFEGDGVFDTSFDTSGSVSHIYESAGVYNPVVKVTDNNWLINFDYSQIIKVGSLSVKASASPVSGNAPVTVNFSGVLFDPIDGRIGNYQWDFDGDGTFEFLSATSAATSYIYRTIGIYKAVLKVTDTDGVTATDSAVITVTGAPPNANVSANPSQGVWPLTVNLSSSGSNDPDGSIVLYQWDFNSDNVFDWSSISADTAVYTYNSKGKYNPLLKITDNSGLTGLAYCTLTVNQAPPTIQASANPVNGNAPLTVNFNGTGSDRDGQIVNYEWNFDGNGTYDWNSGSTGVTSYTYSSAGVYNAVFKATDNEGAFTSTSVSIKVFASGNPLASAFASPNSGSAPLSVSFIGTGSDLGGQIVKYEWDFGDGYKLDSSGYPTTQLFFGSWPATGCSDTTSYQTGIENLEPSEGLIYNNKTWFKKSDSDGNFDWDEIFGQSSNTYAYSHIYVYLPQEQTVRIKFGADDACRFWINGNLVFKKTGCEIVTLNQYSFDAVLNQGWNRILVSVSEGGGWWGAAYRLTDTSNNPLQLFYSINKPFTPPDSFWSSDSTGTINHDYDKWGNYTASFKVTDNIGLYSTASVLIKVQSKPIPNLKTNVIQGNVPLEVSLQGTGNDPDGNIVKYELDFEGDNIYDLFSTTNININHIYQNSGVYNPVLKVTDNDGYFDTASLTIAADRSFPFVQLSASPKKGNSPLFVFLKANSSDRDGFITLYEWDFDGDGVYDSSSNFDSLVYVYDSTGNYHPKVRVTDNDSLTAISSANILVNPTGSPEAKIYASPAMGSVPLDVYFSGRGSDLNGQITKYEFDFNGDGVYDTSFNTLAVNDSVKCVYNTARIYSAGLKVTDNDGLTDYDSVKIFVSSASLWVADHYNNQVVKLGVDGKELNRLSGFNGPYTVSVNTVDGSCWVADYYNSKIVKLNSSGQELFRLSGFVNPTWVSVDPNDGSCWVSDYGNHKIVKLNKDGQELFRIAGFYYPRSVSVNTGDGSCWVANSSSNQIVKLSSEGVELIRISGFNNPLHISVNSYDGSCWICNTNSGQIIKLNSTGQELFRIGGFNLSWGRLVVNPADGSCWIADSNNNRIIKLDSTGKLISISSGFSGPQEVRSDIDGGCWVGDTNAGKIVKLSANGTRLFEKTGFNAPTSISINSGTTGLNLPEAIAVITPFTGDTPLSVSFLATAVDSTASIINYEWDFEGDGVFDLSSSNESGANVSHTYSSTGIYSPVLRVTNSNGLFGYDYKNIVRVGPAKIDISQNKTTGTAPLSVSFTASAFSPNSFITKYEWDFQGDGVFDTSVAASSISYTYNRMGKYQPILKVTDQAGTEFIKLASEITVTQSNPTAVLSVTPASGTRPLGVLFKMNSSSDPDGSLTLYEIDYNNDGIYDWNGKIPDEFGYIYNSAGIYKPVLRVTDNDGLFSTTQVIVTVNSIPVTVSAQISPARGKAPLNVSFSGTANSEYPITLYQWNFNGDSTYDWSSDSTGVTNYTYNTVGNYKAVFKATDSTGAYATTYSTVTVLSQGNPTAVASALPVTGDTPLKVDFIGSGIDSDGTITKYEWDFDGNGAFDLSSDTTGNASYIYNTVGNYSPVFKVTDNSGLWDTARLSIFAGIAPVALPQAYPVTGQIPLTVTFTSNGSDQDGVIYNYEWDFDGNGTYDYSSVVPDKVSYTYKVPGTYKAKLRVTDNDGLKGTGEVTIQVSVPSMPQVLVSANPTQGIVPLNVSFSGLASDLDGVIKKFEWDFTGDGLYDWVSDSSATTSYTYESVGIYKAILKVTDNDNNFNTMSVNINAAVSKPPEVTAAASPASGNTPLKVSFAVSNIDTTSQITKYEWDFDGDSNFDFVSDTTGNTSYTYTLANDYTAVLRVTNSNNVSSIKTIPISVSMGISATLSQGGFYPALGETISINSVLTQPAKITLRVVDRNQNPVRIVISNINRDTGFYSDIWNGKDDNGNLVKVGIYYFIIDYEINGKTYSYNLTNTSGNYEVASFSYPVSFSPYDGKLCTLQYTLTVSSEITIYVFWSSGGLPQYKMKTICMREPQKAGNYVAIWDGTNSEGIIAPSGSYVLSILKWALAKNAIIISGRPIISDVILSSSYYFPSAEPPSNKLYMQFRLSKQANIKVVVRDELNNIINQAEILDVKAGLNTINWSGMNKDGDFVGSGKYSLGIQAIDAAGNMSNWVYGVIKVFY